MRKQDYLVQLIQSLDANERRYFKLYSSLQQGDKKFLQLYDCLDGKTEYNATALCKELNVTAGQLAKLKQYLNQELLSALRIYAGQGANLIALHDRRTDGRVLIGKRLYDYALEVTGKAIEVAWRNEQFELLLGLMSNQYACHFNLGNYDELAEVDKTRHKLTAIINEISTLDYLDGEAYRIDDSIDGHEGMKKLLLHPIFKVKPDKLLSLRAKAGWYRVLGKAYGYLEPGGRKHVEISRMQKVFYESNPTLSMFYGFGHIKALTSLADAECMAGNFDDALSIYSELEALLDAGPSPLSRVRAASIKAYIYTQRMIVFCNMGAFEKVVPEEKKLQPIIAEREVREQIDAAFILAVAKVHLGRSDLAIDKMNEMLELDIADHPPHLKTIRPLLIMAHIDLGNYQLIPYQVKSAKAWMKRNKYVEPEYDVFFSLISAVANPPKNSTRRKAYAALLNALKEDRLKKLNKEVYLERWVQGKLKIT